jgi:hypothetical protein
VKNLLRLIRRIYRVMMKHDPFQAMYVGFHVIFSSIWSLGQFSLIKLKYK